MDLESCIIYSFVVLFFLFSRIRSKLFFGFSLSPGKKRQPGSHVTLHMLQPAHGSTQKSK